MEVRSSLTDYIERKILKGRAVTLTPELNLLESGILNSLGILQLVSFIEEQFDIEVPAEDVVYENFHSVGTIDAYIQAQASQTPL